MSQATTKEELLSVTGFYGQRFKAFLTQKWCSLLMKLGSV
jgi:hypothetical protein